MGLSSTWTLRSGKLFIIRSSAFGKIEFPVIGERPIESFVFLQAQSTEPINPKGQANFNEWFARHVATIREAGSEPIAIITWALKGKPEQYQKLADATITQANKLGVYTIPVGPAFAESLKGRPDLILHMPDKRHPTAAGSYPLRFGDLLGALSQVARGL